MIAYQFEENVKMSHVSSIFVEFLQGTKESLPAPTTHRPVQPLFIGFYINTPPFNPVYHPHTPYQYLLKQRKIYSDLITVIYADTSIANVLMVPLITKI